MAERVNPLEELTQRIRQLAEEGYSGEELLEKAMEDWNKEEHVLGLHDMFEVSEEEEASWYDETSRKVRTFNDLISVFTEEHELDATKGYVRKGIRLNQTRCSTFFLEWIGRVQDLVSEVQLGKDSFLSRETLNTIATVCYFAAETHDTAFFYPILECMRHLHISTDDYDDEDRFMPLSTFVYQGLGNVLYATCDDDFERIMGYLQDVDMDDELQNELCKVLAQLAEDGVFSAEEEQKMISQYFHFLHKHGGIGDSLAQWIVRSGKANTMKRELKILLEENIPYKYYATTDPREFAKMIRPDQRLCEAGTVMDDMILFGMYPRAIHAPEAIREKAIAEQNERIRKMKH